MKLKVCLAVGFILLAACGSSEKEPGPVGLPHGTFAFAAIGDFGTGDDDAYAVADRMCSWRQDLPFEVVITTGDNVYDQGEPERFEAAFKDPFACLLDDGVSFHASLGNHDVLTDGGRPQIEDPDFGMGGRNYVHREAGVRFVVADSNDLDVAWLTEALESQRGDRWTVVVFHHPVYSGGNKHGSTPGFAENLGPLFSRQGVDLVLNGHEHLYSATSEVDGVHYVVTGGGGAQEYPCDMEQPVVTCESVNHFVYVEVSEAEMLVVAVPVEGDPIDSFVIAQDEP